MCATLQATPTSAGPMGRRYHENATSMFIPPPNKHICASFAVLQLWFAYALSYWKLVPNVAVLRSDATFSSWLDRSAKLVLSFCAQDWNSCDPKRRQQIAAKQGCPCVLFLPHAPVYTSAFLPHYDAAQGPPQDTDTDVEQLWELRDKYISFSCKLFISRYSITEKNGRLKHLWL